LQIFFGKLEDSSFEIKKVDLIKIDFELAPVKFLVYTWYPGSSWSLLKAFDKNRIYIKNKKMFRR